MPRKSTRKTKDKGSSKQEPQQDDQQDHPNNEQEKENNGNDNDNKQNDTTNENGDSPSPVSSHLLFCGSSQWDLIGRKNVPKAVLDRGGSDQGEELLSPTVLHLVDYPGLRIKSVWSGPCASHAILLSESGEAYGIGRNDNAQLAQADLCSRWGPAKIILPDGERPVSASCGRSSTLLIMESGTCYGVGSNASGQLGIGCIGAPTGTAAPSKASKTNKPQKQMFVTSVQRVHLPLHEKVISVAAAPDFSVFACKSGAVYTCGCGENYQLGNGQTGEYIGRANSVTYENLSTPTLIIFVPRPSTGAPQANGPDTQEEKEIKIKQVAAGTCHSLALDADGKVWSWGFGGYGRLGHKTTSDEKLPRMIEFFDLPHLSVDQITCGQACSVAVQFGRKSLYSWGLVKRNGDCNMYPKPVFDLFGHPVHDVKVGFSSTVLATEKTVVSWGMSPAHGELGYGPDDPKSSSTPKIVDAVDGLYCKSVAEGTWFTFLVVDVNEEDKEEKATLDKLGTKELSNDPDAKKKKGGDKRKKNESVIATASKPAKGRKKKRTK